MKVKLVASLFTCAIIASTSVFAMDDDEIVPRRAVTMSKIILVDAWENNKELRINGRLYRLTGTIEGEFGVAFLSSAVFRDSTKTTFSFHPTTSSSAAERLRFVSNCVMSEITDGDPERQTFSWIAGYGAKDGKVDLELIAQ